MNKTARRNMLFLIFLLLVTYVHSQELVVKRCTASQYFDITSLQCYECVDSTETKSQNKVPSKTHIDKYGNSLSCTCAPGYIELRTACGSGTPANSLNICPKFTCSQCPKDEAPTLDKTDCLPCAAPSVVVNGVTQTPSDGSTFSTETKECSCGTKAGIAKHLVERDPYTNTFFRYKKCLSCPSKELVLAPKTDPYMCSACPHPNMTFDSTTLSCTCQPSSVFETVGLASYGNQNCIYKTEVYSGSQGAEASQLSYWTVQETADYYYWPPQEATYTKAPSKVESVVFKHYMKEAASRCAYYGEAEDLVYCEQLANLCALTLYDTASKACQILGQIQLSNRPTVTGFTDWKQTVPYIVVGEKGVGAVSNKLTMTMSFDQKRWLGTHESLNFTLAAYSLNGTFLGFEQLTDQFQWCKKKSSATVAGGTLENADGGSTSGTSSSTSTSSTSSTAETVPTYGPPPSGTTRWLKHGTSFSEKYWCDLEALAEMEEPKFYDVYIVDKTASTSASLTMYPVPIRVLNYGGNTGQTPNINGQRSDEVDDQYHRRLFLYDQVSGVSAVGAAPEIIRYADYIEIETMIVEKEADKMHVPIITVHYTERKMGTAGLSGPMKTAMLEFKVLYSQNMDDFWAASVGLFIVCVIFVGFVWFVRVGLYMRRNTRPGAEFLFDANFVTTLFLNLFSSWTAVMFWYLFAMCIYWFFFYKVSTAVYCMLPDDRLHWLTHNDYYPFRVILGLCFVGQVFKMIEIIKSQCSIDIFLMDWETPRGKLVNPREAAGKTKTAPISAWRTIFCANEWNEMQSQRKTDSTFTILFILFLFVGCDMQYVATPQPDINDLSRGDVNPVLRFAHTALWFLIIEAIQLFWNWAVWNRYVDEPLPQLFRDVCSIAKISLFILDEKFHGYYLHCNSPAPYADANMLEMSHHFNAQSDGIMIAQPIPDDEVGPDQQPLHECFEVYVTKAWRDKYDSIFTSVSKKALRNKQRQQAAGDVENGGQGRKASGMQQRLGNGAPPDQLVKASRKLNKFLRNFISKTEKTHLREMRENTAAHRVLRVPPELSDLYTSVIYGDTDENFTSVLIHGVEMEMVLFNILTWSVMDLWLDDTVNGKIGNNPVAAALVTWLAEKLFLMIRNVLGSMNINKKTLVDDKFLL